MEIWSFLNHLVILRLTLYFVHTQFSQTPFFVRFLFNYFIYLSNLHMWPYYRRTSTSLDDLAVDFEGDSYPLNELAAISKKDPKRYSSSSICCVPNGTAVLFAVKDKRCRIMAVLNKILGGICFLLEHFTHTKSELKCFQIKWRKCFQRQFSNCWKFQRNLKRK